MTESYKIALIDTNILIHLEDSSRTLDASFSEVVRLCQENNHNILIHPASYDDLKRDQNLVRREIIYTRLQKYSILEQPPGPYRNGFCGPTAPRRACVRFQALFDIAQHARADFLR